MKSSLRSPGYTIPYHFLMVRSAATPRVSNHDAEMVQPTSGAGAIDTHRVSVLLGMRVSLQNPPACDNLHR
jgi:hypothetical protein